MTLSGIYGITDPTLLPPERLLEAAEAALSAGLCMLQYRDKISPAASRNQQARELLSLCRRYQTPLIINDDVELCRAVNADGVHLGQGDSTMAQAREQLGAGAIVGISCQQSLELAEQAEHAGADYVAFGRFFPSTTKPDAPPAPISILYQARERLSVPVVAIGGINAENGAALIAAGADMLAVIQSLFGDSDVFGNAGKLVSLFNHSQLNHNQHTTP